MFRCIGESRFSLTDSCTSQFLSSCERRSYVDTVICKFKTYCTKVNLDVYLTVFFHSHGLRKGKRKRHRFKRREQHILTRGPTALPLFKDSLLNGSFSLYGWTFRLYNATNGYCQQQCWLLSSY